MEPRRRVHPLIQVFFLNIGVAVEVDDADFLGRDFRDTAHTGKADGVVAADHDREAAGGGHMAHRPRDLVKGFLKVRGDREHVARIAERHLFAQVDADFVVVGRVKRRDFAHALRAEPGAGAIGRAAVERDTKDGRVVMRDLQHVLGIGRFQERIDARVMWQLAPREGGDRLVLDAVGPREAHAQRPAALLVPAALGQVALFLHRLPAAQLGEVRVVFAPLTGVQLGREVAGMVGSGVSRGRKHLCLLSSCRVWRRLSRALVAATRGARGRVPCRVNWRGPARGRGRGCAGTGCPGRGRRSHR